MGLVPLKSGLDYSNTFKAQVERMTRELRCSAQRLIEMDEKLRRELAAELHDEIGSGLSALGLHLSILRNKLPDKLRAGLAGHLDEADEMLAAISCRFRGLMAKLRPPVLNEYGLPAALRWHSELFSRRSGLTVELAIADDFTRLSPEQELALFRIVQETFNNTSKHAHASTITLALSRTGRTVVMSISDDGSGFDITQAFQCKEESGWGLTIMRERATLIGASFHIDSAPGQGTTITVTLTEDLR